LLSAGEAQRMRWALFVVFALLLIPDSAYSKRREYHWKTGKLTISTVETSHQTTFPQPQPDLSVPSGMQVAQETWTYQVDGDEGVYIVRISPEPLTTISGVSIQYDIDGKTMHVDVPTNGKKPKIKDLQILKFTPK
jgi:hypothetical protein